VSWGVTLADEQEVYRGFLPGESTAGDVPFLGPVISALAPVERDVITPPETTYTEDMGVRYPVTTAGEYGDPRVGTPAAVQGILDFVQYLRDDPKAAASAIGEGIASIPEQQFYGGLAMRQGFGSAYNPETGETYTYDPLLLPATTAAGTMASIARLADDGSTVLGIMGGRNAVSGVKKEKKFNKAKEGGLLKGPADDREAFSRTKGYIEPSDGKFRFEIDTSKAKLSKIWRPSKLTTSKSTKENPEFYYGIDWMERTRKNKFGDPTLSELIDFPELFKEYPDIADIPVKQMPLVETIRGTKAAYDTVNDEMYIGSGSKKSLMSFLLHEIQHAVQGREGFVKGASIKAYLPDNHYENLATIQKSSSKKAKELSAILEKQAADKGIPSSKINVGQFNLVRKAQAYFSGDTEQFGYFDFSKVANQKQLEELKDLVDDKETIDVMEAAIVEASKLYQRQPGEVEARTVQKKFDEDRQGEFPLDVQDTPPEDYVYNIKMKNLATPTVNKAEGGIISLLDVARNTGRGPRGVSSLAPVARNMNRPMVS
jgi:hypothetical protein